jgi:hypothetical protein
MIINQIFHMRRRNKNSLLLLLPLLPFYDIRKCFGYFHVPCEIDLAKKRKKKLTKFSCDSLFFHAVDLYLENTRWFYKYQTIENLELLVYYLDEMADSCDSSHAVPNVSVFFFLLP